MNILLHTCCAPCLSGARIGFESSGIGYRSYFFNPNIHPIPEHHRRLSCLKEYSLVEPFELIDVENPDHEGYLDIVMGESTFRRIDPHSYPELATGCGLCYALRLYQTADKASYLGMDGFSTTLLLSKYQKHDIIRACGNAIEDDTGLEFIYIDLRKYWGASLNASRKHHLYRQRYCGCIRSCIGSLDREGSITQ